MKFGLGHMIGFAAPDPVPPLTVEATNTSSEDTSAAQTVTLPSGIAAGDLLIVFLICNAGPTVTTPSGWTELFKVVTASSISIAAYYKIADGSEGLSVDVTIGSAQTCAHTSYRISGWQGTPEAVTNAANADPPSITPTWGSAETLYIAIIGWATETVDITAAPTNYSNLLSANGTGAAYIGSAERKVLGTSENPGTFTGTAATLPRSATVAIQPA